MDKFRVKIIVFVLVLTFGLPVTTFAQNLSNLTVEVNDPNGDYIRHYSVLLTQLKDNITQKLEITGEEKAIFSKLKKTTYLLRITTDGFKSLEKQIDIYKDYELVKISLEINEIKAEVSVELTKRQKAFEDSISKVYTKQEIAALPDDPRSIENKLKRIYGNNTRFQVDGFFGGQIPDKSRIAAITVIFDPVDAEFHFAGDPIVQITTKPGGKKWTGFFSTTIGNSLFNARNAFETKKFDLSDNSILGSLTPPQLSKNTSVSFSFNASKSSTENSFIGSKFNNDAENNRRNITTIVGTSVNIYQNISKNQVGFFRYNYSASNSKGVGIGPLDLAERAFTNFSRHHNFRYSQSGIFGENTNHFRTEFSFANNQIKPNSNKVATNILDAVNFGGATNNSEDKSWASEISDNFTFAHKKHLIKIGFETSINSLQRTSRDNINGTFTFSSLENYKNQSPLLFTQRQNPTSLKIVDVKFSGFIQDYIRVSEFFQMGIGLRYEWQNSVGNLDNYSPRFSFAWSPEKSGKLIETFEKPKITSPEPVKQIV